MRKFVSVCVLAALFTPLVLMSAKPARADGDGPNQTQTKKPKPNPKPEPKPGPREGGADD